MRRGLAVVLVVVVASATLLTGCGRERVCSRGEYPVRSMEFPESGRLCVKDGQEPPAEYERFPPGQVPTYVDQDR